MKLVVWKNYLGGQILYRSVDPPKKRRQRKMGKEVKIGGIPPNMGRGKPWRFSTGNPCVDRGKLRYGKWEIRGKVQKIWKL